MARHGAVLLPLYESVRPVLEGLEERRLLAASLDGGILTVDGTAGKDSITVAINSTGTRYTVTIGKASQNFKAANVDRIVINGGDGNDKIRFNEKSRRIGVKTVINGGNGNDRITGSTRNDNVRGGEGRDFILGGKGNDRLSGEASDDTIFGDAGNDVLFGGGGEDILGGDDEGVFAIAGRKIPAQISGNDRLDGGDGDDWLLGGIRYERGVMDNAQVGVQVFNDDDTDTMTGGEGADIIGARGSDDVITDEEGEDTVPSKDIRPTGSESNHLHAQFRIRLRNSDGSFDEVIVPDNIGLFGALDAAHTHDNTGRVHFESDSNAPYLAGEFLENWGLAFSPRIAGRIQNSSGTPIRIAVKHDNDDPAERLDSLFDYEIQDEDKITITIG